MRRSDKAVTFALCASLAVHAWVGSLAIRERISELMARLSSPPLPETHALADEDADAEGPPASVILPPPTPTIDSSFAEPKPPPATPKNTPPKNQPDTNQENLEWGEKNGRGFAITSAPGKDPMRARQGVEDQSFASRDPEGPEPFPDQPSPSVAPPGEGGKAGAAALKELLKDKGTQSAEPVKLARATPMVSTPPTPKTARPTVASSSDQELDVPQTSGVAQSRMPAAERRSPAEANTPAAVDDSGLPNDVAWGDEIQILPIKSPNLIAIRSRQVPYPEVVAALTRPPGLKIARDHAADPLLTPALPNRVVADVSRGPAVQAATVAIQTPVRQIEEMARRLGENDPLNGPAVTDALTSPPGESDAAGGPTALPEIAMADRPAAAQTQDAIVALSTEAPRPEELAQQVEQGETAAMPKTAVASAQTSQNARPGLPGPDMPAADPAPDTGLESDPFSKLPSVEFNAGKVEARSGRQIKPIRPRLTEAGKRDLLAQQFPTILLKVRIDRTGKVTDVNIIQGSGSEAVDMPVYRAMWEWWFEPPKDKKGNPLEDVQLVAIHWG